MLRKSFLLCLALVLGLAGLAFGADDAIKIGVFLPLTGQNAFGGQLELEGVQMANKENPEILGKKVELVVVDNKSDKVEAANAVQRLIEKEKVQAIIGTYGSSLAMGVDVFRYKLLSFTVGSFFAGVGGALLASLLTTIDPKMFLFTLTFNVLMIVVAGGLGSLTGSVLAGIGITVLLEWLRFVENPVDILGFSLPGIPGMISLDDVRAAAARLAPRLRPTPFLPSRVLSEMTGAQVLVKFENHQFTASFKERGALNKLLCLDADQRARGVAAMVT